MRLVMFSCFMVVGVYGMYALVVSSGMVDWNVVAIKRDRSITELTDNDAIKVARAITDSAGSVTRDEVDARKPSYELTTDHSLFKGISIGREVKTFNVYVTKDRVELFEKSVGTRVWYTSFEKGTKPYEILKTWGN